MPKRQLKSIYQHLYLYFTIPFILVVLVIIISTFYYLYLHQEKETYSRLNEASLILQQDTLATLVLARNKYLQATNKSVLEVVKTLHQRQKEDALSKNEVIWLVDEILKNQKLGTDGYTFVVSADRTILIHPDTDKVGQPYLGFKAIEKNIHNEQAYYSYTLKDDQTAAEREIIATFSFFPQWKWTIITELPTSSSNQLVSFYDLPAILQANPLRHETSIFYINDEGKWHISIKEDGTSLLTDEEMLMLSKIISQQNSGHYKYSWKTPQQNQPINKVSFFNEVSQFGITVGFVRNVTSPGAFFFNHTLQLFGIVVIVILTLVLLALQLIKIVGAPFQKLSKQLETVPNELTPIPTPLPLKELTTIASNYNKLLMSLKDIEQEKNEQEKTLLDTQEQLKLEIKASQEAAQQISTERISRKSAENYLLLFKNIFDNAIEGIMITDKENKILTVNKSFTDITGYKAQEIIGENPNILSSGKQSINFYRKMWESLTTKGSWSGEIINDNKDGSRYSAWLSISQIQDANQEVTHYFAFFHDITELKRREMQITAMAYQDALTKLPNRAALEVRLTKALSRAKREKTSLAVLFIDLDNFKNVNDTLGHDKGDQLLLQVADRIKEAVRDEDTLSRLGGDEFILLSEALDTESSIIIVAGRVLDSLKEPFQIGHNKLFINASVGIATYPGDGRSTNELIKNADMAMYKAKNEGKNKFVMFTQEMQEKFVNHIRIENAIRTGLAKKEFVLYYQPKIDILTKKTTSFEALVRWNKNGEIIGPAKFIGIAEESGLIDQMSLYLLEEACKFLQNLKVQNLPRLPISVNMAPRTFNNLDIVETIDSILEQYKIDHKYIEFEVTETTAMENIKHTLDTMTRFRQRGISFSIDDFGTGYSSLSYLNEMPVSTLKIDKRFINLEDSNCKSIVSTITAMSKQMQLKVVAEGVETLEQLSWLESIGCNEAQGYYFARPFPESEVIKYLKENK